MPTIDLRRLIMLLSVIVALLTFANSFYASYQTQRNLLMRHTLEANQVYATKQAATSEAFFQSAQRQLAYSARLLPPLINRPEPLEAETERLKLQTQTFNTTFVVQADGLVLAESPKGLGLLGSRLKSAGAQLALSKRQPLITDPYISATGRLVVFISQPILAADGRYLGYVGGSIYLRENNSLQTLFGEQFYRDGSYLYVVDQNRQLIYHQDPQRVGEIVTGNPVIEAVLSGQQGQQRLLNSKGIDMLAGYASIPSTRWGVVAQSPADASQRELQTLMLDILLRAIPFSLISLLAIWWLSGLIAQPLRYLANTAKHWESPTSTEQIKQMRAWYFEAAQLKDDVLTGLALLHKKLGRLNQENISDPLTGLHNRRGMRMTLDQWQTQQQAFAVLMIDLDHFKQVNDTYGHDIGDQVLQHLAQCMRDCSRSSDILCRNGGEEFAMLLPASSLEDALQVGERLRATMATRSNPSGTCVTLSAGVAHWPDTAKSVQTVLKRADEALYQAKHGGRNRITAAQPET